jgi:ABC-type anion transport system duplicated permease subunit
MHMTVRALRIDQHDTLILTTIQTYLIWCLAKSQRRTVAGSATKSQSPNQTVIKTDMREMKTSFVLLLGIVCVPAVSAIQDNVFEFGQFRLLEENGQSVLKPSGKVGRSDQVLMQKSKRSTE